MSAVPPTDDPPPELQTAIAQVPPGRWAVGVSGGADSVALLLLLATRSDLTLHVAHLDHETRAGASAEDAQFVARLAAKLDLPCATARRGDIEAALDTVERNTSARFRAARFAFFKKLAAEQQLAGVILAHHADDLAETVLHRLLRGSGAAGLAGMSSRAPVGGLMVLRPLLGVRGTTLREWLTTMGQAWREDASNESDIYARNRLRKLLANRDDLVERLLRVGAAARELREWLRGTAAAPKEYESLRIRDLLALPAPLQRERARRWLVAAGVPAQRIEPEVVDRFLTMANDRATPRQSCFPGDVLIRRHAGWLAAPAREK